MSNETIYIYDIIKEFGYSGLKKILQYFYVERGQADDIQDAMLCLEDIIFNTRLEYCKDLTKEQIDNAIIEDGHLAVIENI